MGIRNQLKLTWDHIRGRTLHLARTPEDYRAPWWRRALCAVVGCDLMFSWPLSASDGPEYRKITVLCVHCRRVVDVHYGMIDNQGNETD